ncbi:MAG TPA: sugar O-acetyltransferase [Bacilli bacterium]|nr:sugar O-acetyltransferase [Bacilli bacterium]
MSEKDRMLEGKLYIAQDEEIANMNLQARKLVDMFNATRYDDFDGRQKIIKQLFAKTGEAININKPFFCDYGSNIYIGENFYANYDCILLDVNKIIIGNNVMLGPRVSLFTAGHPIDKNVRNQQLEYGKEIIIGDDVWIGGNVVINPGVTIGSNVVIGSGSIVTHDITDNVVAAGNPCRIIRKIDDQDKRYWEKLRDEYFQ